MSRNLILENVKRNHAPFNPLPTTLDFPIPSEEHWFGLLKDRLELLHVDVVERTTLSEVAEWIKIYLDNKKSITTIQSISDIAGVPFITASSNQDPHIFEDIEYSILPARFIVAENGAAWLTEEEMAYRVLPFIAQQIVLVVSKKNVIYNMHQAYNLIGEADYGFSAFIAGPSKTADIEQSLVLGAHGPKGMTIVFTEE